MLITETVIARAFLFELKRITRALKGHCVFLISAFIFSLAPFLELGITKQDTEIQEYAHGEIESSHTSLKKGKSLKKT